MSLQTCRTLNGPTCCPSKINRTTNNYFLYAYNVFFTLLIKSRFVSLFPLKISWWHYAEVLVKGTESLVFRRSASLALTRPCFTLKLKEKSHLTYARVTTTATTTTTTTTTTNQFPCICTREIPLQWNKVEFKKLKSKTTINDVDSHSIPFEHLYVDDNSDYHSDDNDDSDDSAGNDPSVVLCKSDITTTLLYIYSL